MQFSRPLAVALVEDDADFRAALAERLELDGLNVTAFASAEAALKTLDAGFQGVVVTDLRMPVVDGRQLLSRLQLIDADLPVIMMTGHGDVAEAVEALRNGAYDFVAKPFPHERLRDSLNRALEKRALVLDNRRLAAAAADTGLTSPLLGGGEAMIRLREAIAQLADGRLDVLIEGETGTGKEVVARALHDTGRRRIHPFVAVNCGALPQGMIDSELFGHEPGAFAGAVRRRVGHIEQSHRGTLFLDQIESMPADVQIKLLRVIEHREVQPLGAAQSRPLDLRILASSRIDLDEAVRNGTFRPDLFYRLNVIKLRIPPLRERREDIPLLFSHFLARAAQREQRNPPAMSAQVRRRLLDHDWPGNVRELAHFAERILVGLDQEGAPPGNLNAAGPTESAPGEGGLAQRIERYEAALIHEVMTEAQGDIAAAMATLQLPRKTLYDKLARHGLKPADYRPRSH